jgi:anti-sigma regulatory factor (Ser/Thr protein kinase)
LTLPPNPAAVGQARRFVQAWCRSGGVTEDDTDVVVLLTSEMVTNAFVHGRSEARVAVSFGGGSILVEVADDNSRHPRAVDNDNAALDGRGLTILSNLATHWGVRDEKLGKTVWFVVTAQRATA